VPLVRTTALDVDPLVKQTWLEERHMVTEMELVTIQAGQRSMEQELRYLPFSFSES